MPLTAGESKTSASDVIKLFESLSVTDLSEVITAAEQQREARRESGKQELIQEFRAKAEALGLSLDELLGGSSPASHPGRKAHQPRRSARTASPNVKYRNPDTGETWSGRGRVPRWLATAEEQGRSRGDFAA
jgi:DNA-binding protein H-NS